jgi:drug/metabolite transporter (DMT)-like permease
VVGVNRSAIFVNLIPVFGAALAIIFLGESLYLYHFLGAGLICLGILMVVRGHK